MLISLFWSLSMAGHQPRRHPGSFNPVRTAGHHGRNHARSTHASPSVTEEVYTALSSALRSTQLGQIPEIADLQKIQVRMKAILETKTRLIETIIETFEKLLDTLHKALPKNESHVLKPFEKFLTDATHVNGKT